MLCRPSRRSVRQCLRKEDYRTCRRVRNDNTGRFFGRIAYLLRQLKVAFMAAGDTTEAAKVRSRVRHIPRGDDEAINYLIVSKGEIFSPPGTGVRCRSAVVGVESSPLHPLAHTHPINSI